MSIPRLARSRPIFKPVSECLSQRRARDGRRSLHTIPQLSHEEHFERNGVSGLFTTAGYATAWKEYQYLVTERLNSITQGYPEYDQDPKAVVLKHARNPNTASLFNHASMAHNNHFFFKGLSPTSRPLTDFKSLHDSLLATYGSIDTLKDTMLLTAEAMFGPGFVWLVWARAVNDRADKSAWRILTTYNAGTPYPEAGYRQQDRDMNTQRASNAVGQFGAYSQPARAEANRGPGTAALEPVLCVSTWQHCYLRDFGVAGKPEYLQRWWEAIDWHVVDNLAPADSKSQNRNSWLADLQRSG